MFAQVLGKAEATSVCSAWYGGVALLGLLGLTSPEGKPVAEKLRSAGTDSFRFVLEHPLVHFRELGMNSGKDATTVAALVWGRDEIEEGASVISFKQSDMNYIVRVTDLRNWELAKFFPMAGDHGQAILSLCVSE